MSDPHIKTITGIDPDVKIKEELFVDEGLTAAEYEQKIPLSPNIKGEELDIKKEAFYEEDEDSATSNIITDDPEIDPDFTVTTASTAGRRRKVRRKATENDGSLLWQCPSCKYESTKESNLKKHMLIHSTSKQLKCGECNYRCHWQSWMERHIASHKQNHSKPYKCPTCNYRTRWKSCMDRHRLNHAQLRPFKCSNCESTFVTKGDLRIHTLVHTNDKPYKCHLCSYSTSRKRQLKVHLEKHENGLSVSVTNGGAGAKGRRISSIKDMQYVTLEGFRCPECDYRCEKKCTLLGHLKKHTQSGLYRCDQCDYNTFRKDYLESHLLRHSKVKAYGCPECSFKCSWRSALRRHLLTHLDVKPFCCSQCDYRSGDKTNLKRHVHKHFMELSS